MSSDISNMEINKKENFVLISVNPKLYSREVVYSAAYSIIDRAYVIMGGNPEDELLVELRPKRDADLETMGREFNNELLNWAVYIMQSERTKKEKELLMEKALETHSQGIGYCEECSEKDLIEEPPIEDPENIAKPWTEDSYKDEAKQNKKKKTNKKKKKKK